VVETDIHHPTDNTLLWDVVRVLTRLLGRLAEALELPRISGFRNRSRAAHRRMYEIQRMTTRQRQGVGSRQTAVYRALIAIAEEVVASARKAKQGDAGAGPIHFRTSTGISGSCACAGLGTTCRG
jgi:transposase, IS5 family